MKLSAGWRVVSNRPSGPIVVVFTAPGAGGVCASFISSASTGIGLKLGLYTAWGGVVGGATFGAKPGSYVPS
jgi:hypothetical protein